MFGCRAANKKCGSSKIKGRASAHKIGTSVKCSCCVKWKWGEKKKPLKSVESNQIAKVQEQKKTSPPKTESEAVIPPPQTPSVPIAEAPQVVAPKKSTTFRKNRRKSEFQIPTNLNEATTHYEKALAIQQALKNSQVEEEAATYQVNNSIQIDEQSFQKLLNQYIEKLKAQNSMNLASCLQEGKTNLTHNHWTLTLENGLLKGMLDREKEGILLFLRQELQVPELYLTIEIDENPQNVKAKKPYTNEEKLKEMAQKNPSLKKLQEIFKTRIIY